MAWLGRVALVGCVLAACKSETVADGGSGSSSDSGNESSTGSTCEPIAAVLVRISEAGSPASADVSYRVADGPWIPAACVQLGQCIVTEGYGQAITVRVQAYGCSWELATVGASDMCATASPELAFTVYDNCSGDPTSEGGYDSSSEGDTSTSSSSGDVDGTSGSSSGSSSESSSTD